MKRATYTNQAGYRCAFASVCYAIVTLSYTVFYPLKDNLCHFNHLYFDVCNLLNLDMSKIMSLGKELGEHSLNVP